MFANRISALFPSTRSPQEALGGIGVPAQQVLPMASIEEIFQAALNRARNDCELDRLFNAEYYGDHGSGI
jgi:hypothetical protein